MKKTDLIRFRTSTEEKLSVESDSKNLGLSISDYIRKAIWVFKIIKTKEFLVSTKEGFVYKENPYYIDLDIMFSDVYKIQTGKE